MASGTNMVDFTDDQIKMRWREPYVTEGLNKHFAGVVPRGIYRGFRLKTAYPTAMTVNVLADPVKGDHVALYETDTAPGERYSMRVEITSGDFVINLGAWPSQLVYICIYAEYTTLATTLANIRVYTEAEYAGAAEKDELIVLGTVNVPAAGAILAEDVTGSFRTLPFDNLPTEARPWVPIFKNADFEAGPVASILGENGIPWHRYSPSVGGADYVWGVIDTDSYEGTRCAELYVQAANPTAVNLCGQDIMFPVQEGQRIKYRMVYKPVQTSSADNMQLRIYTLDDWGTSGPIIDLGTLDTTVTGSWIVMEGMVTIPAGVSFINRIYCGCTLFTMNFPALGAALRIDSMQLWAEPIRDPVEDTAGFDVIANRILMLWGGGHLETDPELGLDSSGLVIRRRDGTTSALVQPKAACNGGFLSGAALIQPTSGADFEEKTSETARYGGYYRSSATVPNLMNEWFGTTVSSEGGREFISPASFGRFWTYNAFFDSYSGEWRCDQTVSMASMISQGVNGVSFHRHAATGGTWPDASWEVLLNVDSSSPSLISYIPLVFSNSGSHLYVGTIQHPGPTSGKLCYELLYHQNTPSYTRTYLSTIAWEQTLNALYSGTWASDTNTYPAIRWRNSAANALYCGWYGEMKLPTAGTWGDFAWDRELRLGFAEDAGYSNKWLPSLYLVDDDTWTSSEYQLPTSSLYNRNTVKAWVTCYSNSGTPSGIYGYNVSSVTVDGTGYLVITLSTALDAAAKVCVVANLEGGGTAATYTASPTVLAANQIRVACYSSVDGFYDLGLVNLKISVVVLGVS